MAKLKTKAKPNKDGIKMVDEEKKKKKISRPRKSLAMKSEAPREDFLENISFRRKIRTGMERSVHSGSVERNGTILKKNVLSEEQNDDLGEFAKAIVRFQREAQLQLNKEYKFYDGRWEDLANQGGGSPSERENFVMSPDDYAHADVDADANMEADTNANADANMETDTNANGDADANMEADTNANANADANMEADANANVNADANMEANTSANAGAESNETEKQLTEDYLEDDLEAQPESQSGRKRNGRGPTTLPHLTRTDTRVRKVVEYNENGQPIGSVSVELASYMGVLARRMVPISHQTWRKVPNTLIEKLWSLLERRFVLDPRSRKLLITGIGDKWRGFKSSLTRKHVLPFKDQVDLLTHPPKMYGFINQEHWDAFVKSRLSKAFQVVHKAQSDKRGKNLYPHRLSRRGYATLAEDLKNSGEITPNEIDRSLLWKKARQNNKGEYVNDVTREKAMMIDELKNKLKEGTLVNDVNDVLTLALGTPEKHGRVRGVGQFVGPTAFFQMPKRGSSKSVRQMNDQTKLIEGKWQEEIVSRIQVEDQLRATQGRVAQLEEQLAQATNKGSIPTLTSEKVCSNTTDYPTSANLEPMQNNEYGKSIDDKMYPPDPKSRHSKELDMSTFLSFYNRASQILTSKLSSIPIVVDEAVFGTDMELFLDLDDIRYMCEMEDLSANCIMVYIRHLHDILVSKGMQHMYAFVNPVFVSSESGEYISNMITERLQTTECQWVFVPFNPEQHWILVVINMRTMGCYWLDPLGLPDQYKIKPLVNVGLKALQVDGKRRPNPIWYTVKSPKQSCNSLCGMYVMRYMRELIDELANPLTKKQPFTKLTYNQDEIDAARLEWIHFVEKYM